MLATLLSIIFKIFYLLELLFLNKIPHRILIPNACQNPIELIQFTAPTKALFQSHCVGQANIIAPTAISAIADNNIPNLSILINCS